jgi:hypothetical protein
MAEHEQKNCPCCKDEFTCKAGSITLGECRKVELSTAQRQNLAERYEDCLCRKCMIEERRAFNVDQFKARIDRLIGR